MTATNFGGTLSRAPLARAAAYARRASLALSGTDTADPLEILDVLMVQTHLDVVIGALENGCGAVADLGVLEAAAVDVPLELLLAADAELETLLPSEVSTDATTARTSLVAAILALGTPPSGLNRRVG